MSGSQRRSQVLGIAAVEFADHGLHGASVEAIAREAGITQAYVLQHVGVAAKLENWARVFEFFETVTYEIRDLRFTVGDDVAFGHGFARSSGTLKQGTATTGMWVRVTYGMRRIDGEWLIAHDQVSVPLDVQTGRGVTDLEP